METPNTKRKEHNQGDDLGHRWREARDASGFTMQIKGNLNMSQKTLDTLLTAAKVLNKAVLEGRI